VPFFGVADGVARREPVDGDVVIGIGEARPGLARARRLAAFAICIPGDRDQALDRGGLGGKRWIGEAFMEAGAECRLAQLGVGHPLAGLRRRRVCRRPLCHAAPPMS